jgi:aspartyl protease family protein
MVTMAGGYRQPMAAPSELPRSLKLLTIWLLIGGAVFLAFQAWEQAQSASRFRFEGRSVVLKRAPDGHFHWPGRVNGVAVDFLVDTGASNTALPTALAERAGVQARGELRTHTAGGVAAGQAAVADIRLDGGPQVERWPVMLLPQLGAPLLGMDVLGRLNFSQRDGELRLDPR